MDYIKRIKEVKSARKMTNDELSERTGIPGGTLSKILAGISETPKFCNIIAICEALNCSLDYIVSGLEENKNNYTLTDEEIAALGVEKREVVVAYEVGNSVKIIDGALESFIGVVEEIDLERSKVRVVVSMFGRETPVELELDQIELVN